MEQSRVLPIGVGAASFLFLFFAGFQLFIIIATAANFFDWPTLHWLYYTSLVAAICFNVGIGIGLLYLVGIAREWAILLGVIHIFAAIFVLLWLPSFEGVSGWCVAELIAEIILFGATVVYLVVSDRFFVYS